MQTVAFEKKRYFLSVHPVHGGTLVVPILFSGTQAKHAFKAHEASSDLCYCYFLHADFVVVYTKYVYFLLNKPWMHSYFANILIYNLC